MTPVALLAEARARGVVLVVRPPDEIMVRGPRDALPTDLRERLRAVKPELLALLGGEARRMRAAAAWSAAYARLSPLARDAWPSDGAVVLRWVRPELARAIEEAEAAAETAGRAHVVGEPWEAFAGSLERWESAHVEAMRLLARVCHDCGKATAAAVVLDDGRRLCRACCHPSRQRKAT